MKPTLAPIGESPMAQQISKVSNMSKVNVYECKDGRSRVYVKDTKQVISYPRYLMEQKLGRKLKDNEQVHHKDEDPTNNDINNLEIKLLGEHQREHSTKYFDKYAVCQWCGKAFLWTAKQQRQFYDNKRRRNTVVDNPFCSRECSGQYNRCIQTINNLCK